MENYKNPLFSFFYYKYDGTILLGWYSPFSSYLKGAGAGEGEKKKKGCWTS